MMAQRRAESTWDINNHGKYINQFPPNTIKSMWQYERINKKICRQKMSIMFNEICINEEMQPKYTYIYLYIYIYVCVCLKNDIGDVYGGYILLILLHNQIDRKNLISKILKRVSSWWNG